MNKLIVPLVGVLISSTAYGNATPSSALNLLDIYQLAQQSDPTVLSAEAAAGAAKARYKQARGQILPQVSANAGYSQVKQEQDFDDSDLPPNFAAGGSDDDEEFEEQTNLSLNLSQPLFNWPAFKAKQALSARSDQAGVELQAARSELILRSAQAYFDVLAAITQVDSAQRRSAVIETQLKRARASYESGLAPITDLQQAESELDSALVAIIDAENALANSQDNLAELAGRPIAMLRTANAPYVATAPQDDNAEPWVDKALAGNPALQAAELALHAAQKDVEQQRGNHYPTADLKASLGRTEQPVDFGFGTTPLVTETQSIGIEVNIPIFAGFTTSAKVSEARFIAIQQRQELIRTRRQVQKDARSAFRDVKASAARVQALQRAIRSGETSVKAAKAGLATGTRNILDVLQAELDLIQRQADLKRGWYEHAVAGLRLKHVVGTLTIADLERVNSKLSGQAIPVQSAP